jgi:hypothetical protein
MTTEVRITVPGAFDSWLSGTGVAQGQTDGEPDLEAFHRAYVNRRVIRRGRGTSVELVLSRAAAEVMADSAADCISANVDTGADGASEVRAARKVLDELHRLGIEAVR